MAPRASWKGLLRIDAVTCPVALHAAASTSERIAFHTLNRKTGHRVHRLYFDAETDARVDPADQVKGYETPDGDMLIVEPDEIAALIPDSDKIIDVETFIRAADVDDLFLDKPYYLTPASAAAGEAYALIRDTLRQRGVVALGRTVIFRRMRSMLIRPFGEGLAVATLDFDYEVRPPEEAFTFDSRAVEPEMLDLAQHIIGRNMGRFDPAGFDDRYDAALADLVQAKIEGRRIAPPPPPQPTGGRGLLEALRQSAGRSGPSGPAATPRPAASSSGKTRRRKAG